MDKAETPISDNAIQVSIGLEEIVTFYVDDFVRCSKIDYEDSILLIALFRGIADALEQSNVKAVN